jgi:hypothetical protein
MIESCNHSAAKICGSCMMKNHEASKLAEAYAATSEAHLMIAELRMRVRDLEDVLRAIHETAHSHSTGPAEPDILWDIYQDAISVL